MGWIKLSDKSPDVNEVGNKVLIYRITNREQHSMSVGIYNTLLVKHCNPLETWWMILPAPPIA